LIYPIDLDPQQAVKLEELKIARTHSIERRLQGSWGKMIRVSLEEEDNRIRRIAITGDFFFYPEEAFPKFEQALIGVKADEEAIREAVSLAYKKLGVVSVGVDPKDFVAAIMQTLRGRADA